MRTPLLLLALLLPACAAPPPAPPRAGPTAWVQDSATGAPPDGKVWLSLTVFECAATPPRDVGRVDPVQVGSSVATLLGADPRVVTDRAALASEGEAVTFGVWLEPARPEEPVAEPRRPRSGLQMELAVTPRPGRSDVRLVVRDRAHVLAERVLDADLLGDGPALLVAPGGAPDRTYLLFVAARS